MVNNFRASSLPVRREASEKFSASLIRREGHFYEVFLVLAKTRLI